MKIEKINDRQLRWSLDREDMRQNEVKISDFLIGTPKARLLFQEAMKQAERDLSFHSEGYLLHCQLQELSEEKIIFSITKEERIHEDPFLICQFESLDKVIDFAGLFGKQLPLKNSLYKYEDVYMLILEPVENQEEEINFAMLRIADYAEISTLSKSQKAFLTEHGECILEKDALQKLQMLA